MDCDFTYDDSQLQALWAQMQPKERKKALKGAFRRTGNVLKREVVKQIRGKVQSNRELEKGVRVLVFKRKAGFRVTLGEDRKGRKGVYASKKKNRQSREVPVLRFMDTGTNSRVRRRTLYRGGRKKKYAFVPTAPSRGRLQAGNFIEGARTSYGASVTQELMDELREQTLKTAKKYGCI